MVILGASNLIVNDPERFCEAFTLNEASADSSEKAAILVDATSVLLYLASSINRRDHLDLSTIRKGMSEYARNLMKVVGSQGVVHFFFDGLGSPAKTSSQMKQFAIRAAIAERIAKKEKPDESERIIHHFSEWAFQEAIEELIDNGDTKLLHVHRPSHGEAEASISRWVAENKTEWTKIGIISSNSDFLVHDACPGFIPPQSVRIQVTKGFYRLQGQLFSRDKFIKAFFPNPSLVQPLVMTTVAALAGCDLDFMCKEKKKVMHRLRRKIIESEIGGVPVHDRVNPTASATCKAILLYVSHYLHKYGTDEWLGKLMRENVNPEDAKHGIEMINSVHTTYHGSLLSLGQTKYQNPGMVDSWRLLTHGVVFCYPLSEYFTIPLESQPTRLELERRKRRRASPIEACIVVNTTAYAIVPLPPLNEQIRTWMGGSSIWQFPHFRQVRTRLYALVNLYAKTRGSRKNVPLCPAWSENEPPTVVEYSRQGQGKLVRMMDQAVVVPHHDALSTSFEPSVMNLQDDTSVLEECLVMALLGTSRFLPAFRTDAASKHGLIFASSFMLPYNLAALLILMETAPRLDRYNIDAPTDQNVHDEVDLVLPLLSVAVHHGMLLCNTLSLMFPKAKNRFSAEATCLSDIFDYKMALITWQSIRLGRDMEDLPDQEKYSSEDDKNIVGYLEDAFCILQEMKPQNQEWVTDLTMWKMDALGLWRVWWRVFSLEDLKD